MAQLARDAGRYQKRHLDHLDEIDADSGATYRSLLDAARRDHESLWRARLRVAVGPVVAAERIASGKCVRRHRSGVGEEALPGGDRPHRTVGAPGRRACAHAAVEPCLLGRAATPAGRRACLQKESRLGESNPGPTHTTASCADFWP
jgi:hypothetical protein